MNNNYSWLITLLLIFMIGGLILPYILPVILVFVILFFLRSLFTKKRHYSDQDESYYQNSQYTQSNQSTSSQSTPKNGAIDVEYTEREDTGE